MQYINVNREEFIENFNQHKNEKSEQQILKDYFKLTNQEEIYQVVLAYSMTEFTAFKRRRKEIIK